LKIILQEALSEVMKYLVGNRKSLKDATSATAMNKATLGPARAHPAAVAAATKARDTTALAGYRRARCTDQLRIGSEEAVFETAMGIIDWR
jgi:hypothetical protein